MPVHPTFLYESIWCLVGFVALALYVKHRKFHGQIFLLYAIWYGLGRGWIEGLRTDSLLIGNTGLRASQLVAYVTALAAFCLLIVGLRRAKGKTLMVSLAVRDIQKEEKAGDRFSPDALPASAPHAEFVAATEAMSDRLAALDLDALDIEELEDPEPAQPAEKGAAAEPTEEEPAKDISAEPSEAAQQAQEDGETAAQEKGE